MSCASPGSSRSSRAYAAASPPVKGGRPSVSAWGRGVDNHASMLCWPLFLSPDVVRRSSQNQAEYASKSARSDDAAVAARKIVADLHAPVRWRASSADHRDRLRRADLDAGDAARRELRAQQRRERAIVVEAVGAGEQRAMRLVIDDVARQRLAGRRYRAGCRGSGRTPRRCRAQPPLDDLGARRATPSARGIDRARSASAALERSMPTPVASRPFGQRREQQRARAGAEIEDAARARRAREMRDRRLDQRLAVGARDQHAGRRPRGRSSRRRACR